MKDEDLIAEIESTRKVIVKEHDKWIKLHKSIPPEKEDNLSSDVIETLGSIFSKIKGTLDTFLLAMKT